MADFIIRDRAHSECVQAMFTHIFLILAIRCFSNCRNIQCVVIIITVLLYFLGVDDNTVENNMGILFKDNMTLQCCD